MKKREFKDNLFGLCFNRYVRCKRDFSVEITGSTKLIKFRLGSEYKFVFKKFDGMHLVNVVKMDIERRLKSGDLLVPELYNDSKEKVNTIFYNSALVSKLAPCDIVGIDIRSCYFNTAHNLGIISDRAHGLGFKKDGEYKAARNISIGCLGKRSRIERYEGGVMVDRSDMVSPLYPFRLAIIDHVFNTALNIVSKISDGFLFYLTDCFYVLPEYSDKLVSLLSEFGYECKIKKYSWNGITKRYSESSSVKVNWIDSDGADHFHYFGLRHDMRNIEEYKKLKNKVCKRKS